MEFKCVKSDLNNAIQIVEKAVAVRSTLPIIGNILIEASSKGLKLSSNDLEIGIELYMDAEIIEEGAILAPAKTLSSIVNKLSEGEVNFRVDNRNKTILITAGRSKFNIHGLATDDFPVVHKIDKGTVITINAETLKEMVRQTIIAVSMDEVKQFLNGILLEKDKSELRFIATDGFRLAKKVTLLQNDNNDDVVSAIIPSKALQEVNRILQQLDYQGDVTITLSREQVSFTFEKLYFVSRIIQGQFPDYKQVIPKESKSKVVISRKDLLESMERASIIASSSANIIKLEMVDDKLLVTANTSRVGNVSELIDVIKEGDTIQPIAFNVRLILDVIKNIDEDSIVIGLNSPLAPGVVTPKDNKDYTYVIMPIRTAEKQ